MHKARLVALAAAAILPLAGAGTAMASGTPGGQGSVAVTGNIALSCGFTSSTLGPLDMGALTPGATTDPVNLTYSTQCNDASGYTVSVTDAGAKVQQSGNPVSITSDNWTVTGTEGNDAQAWQANGGNVPYVVDAYSAASTTPKTFTDQWSLSVPSSLFYPGALTDTLTYQVFSQ
jgi:hypothetical protein